MYVFRKTGSVSERPSAVAMLLVPRLFELLFDESISTVSALGSGCSSRSSLQPLQMGWATVLVGQMLAAVTAMIFRTLSFETCAGSAAFLTSWQSPEKDGEAVVLPSWKRCGWLGSGTQTPSFWS